MFLPKKKRAKLGTANGALALGRQNELGTLAVGKQAAISCVVNDDLNAGQKDALVDEWLFDLNSRCEPVIDGDFISGDRWCLFLYAESDDRNHGDDGEQDEQDDCDHRKGDHEKTDQVKELRHPASFVNGAIVDVVRDEQEPHASPETRHCH